MKHDKKEIKKGVFKAIFEEAERNKLGANEV
jgi:hypothetical protein